MFKKLGKALGGKGGKGAVKVRFDVQVVEVQNLPSAAKKCRVVFSRNAKVQVTKAKDVRNGRSGHLQTEFAAL